MAKPLVPGLLCLIVDGDVNHVCTLLAILTSPCVCVCVCVCVRGVCVWCGCMCVCVCTISKARKVNNNNLALFFSGKPMNI